MRVLLTLFLVLASQSYAQEPCVNCCTAPKCPPKPKVVVRKQQPKPAQVPQKQEQQQSTTVNVPVNIEIRQEPAEPKRQAPVSECKPLRRNVKVGVHAGYGRSGLKLSNRQTGEATISQDRGFIGGGYLGVRVYKDLWLSGNGLSNGDVFGSVGLEF